MSHDDEVRARADETSFRDVGRFIRFLVIVVLLIGVLLVALDNTDDVRLGYVVGDAQAPVWVAMAGAGVVGLVVGWLIRRRDRG